MDYSYHHWTIRTVMQDSKINVSYQNVPVFNVSQTPWIFLTFSPNVWDFVAQILLSDYAFLSTLDYKSSFYLITCNFDKVVPY